MAGKSLVYLIPAPLDEQGLEAMPPYLLPAIRDCQVFFAENLRSARRFLKSICKDLVIDECEWHAMGANEPSPEKAFVDRLSQGRTIGILSEAGCPGIADPGQTLVALAHERGATVKPLVGPSAVLLALMASGLNGQQFRFCGYLPKEEKERIKKIRELEADSQLTQATQVFIETPYRNEALLGSLCRACRPDTRVCVAASLTGPDQWIQTRPAARWTADVPPLHHRPTIFLLLAAESR
jgi:16S rRNA (cytidine1402-2'-O)-methyltransferase